MTSLGAKLQQARERKGVTASEAAAATRIKIQIIEALEQDRFDRAYAPVYVRGFLKIYGEYLEVDTVDLLSAYEELLLNTSGAAAESLAHQPARRRLGNQRLPVRATISAARSIARHRINALRTGLEQQARERIGQLKAWRERMGARTQMQPPSSHCPPIAVNANAAADAGIPDQSTVAAPTWQTRWQAGIRGPYRTPAAVVVAVLGLVLILLIGAMATRRRGLPAPAEAPRDDPAVTSLPHPLEFTHEPPPPYY